MRSVKKILAALCLSERSHGVYGQAVELAGRFDADLLAANVINVRDVQSVSSIEAMGYNVHSGDYTRGVKEERREQIEKLIEGFDFPRERVSIKIRIGHPLEQILELVQEENADMVVIGAKGRTNLPQLLVGSVAEKVFRHSPVTVVSYREKV